jgi:hypothetical protein
MSMRRRSLIGVSALLVLAALVVGGALAGGAVKATLTHRIQTGPPGTRVAVAWKLRDASGHAVLEKHVFVKITCPEGDRSTITYANPDSHGSYLVSALVPPGGVGSITVGHDRTVYPLTNPYHS